MRQVGRLRHRVSILQRSNELDSLGRQTRDSADWVEVTKPFAEVRELSGNELEKARQIVADVTILVQMWWRKGVTSQHRVRFGDRTFEVRAAIDPDNTRRDLFLYCTETQR